MTIGILLCGDLPATLEAEFGPYSGMIRRLLGSRSARVFDVQNGQLPGSTSTCEAYVITGSSAGVYDDLPWINDLMAFLRNARGRSKLIGICFGHQAMAQAFGGSVIKSLKGWGIGLHRYELQGRPYWMDDGGAVAVPASHQDQVVALPSDARVIARSEFTPYAGLDYGDAISFQFHPEFSPAFATALIEADRDRYGAIAASAIQSHLQPDDCARAVRWIGRFLDSGRGAVL
jgi:GMP synthase-like glutamine amidotransferase